MQILVRARPLCLLPGHHAEDNLVVAHQPTGGLCGAAVPIVPAWCPHAMGLLLAPPRVVLPHTAETSWMRRRPPGEQGP